MDNFAKILQNRSEDWENILQVSWKYVSVSLRKYECVGDFPQKGKAPSMARFENGMPFQLFSNIQSNVLKLNGALRLW